jgi:protein SCO1/2
VLVSIDPQRDTPGRLLEFAHGSRLGERWTLLNGDDDALIELAAVLGVRYRRVSETEFVHSNLITVLDAAGNIAYRQETLGEVTGTAAALREMPELR